jgi:hypothetical protein
MQLILYSRSYCHLCQDMLDALAALRPHSPPFEVRVIDIDDAATDAAILARYDELVPVLTGAEGTPPLCHYFLDKPRVLAYLEGAAA